MPFGTSIPTKEIKIKLIALILYHKKRTPEFLFSGMDII